MEKISLDQNPVQNPLPIDSSPQNLKPIALNPSTPDTKLRFSK